VKYKSEVLEKFKEWEAAVTNRAEAVCNAAYVRNRVITTATAVTPYERWYGKKPDVSNLRVFGCTAYAHVPDAVLNALKKKWN
jgi:hypothetical protein